MVIIFYNDGSNEEKSIEVPEDWIRPLVVKGLIYQDGDDDWIWNRTNKDI